MILEQHVRESNRIEGVENEGLWLSNHLLAAKVVEVAADDTIVHPIVLHAILFNGLEDQLPLVNGYQHKPGEYRQCQVWVGNHTSPPPEAVSQLMYDWWEALGTESPWEHHVGFETIHPFPDGNGRVGRLVYWNEQLRMGEEPELIKAQDRFDYYDKLEAKRG